MQLLYEIPFEGDYHLGLGKWVEIFEAYANLEAGGPIQVQSMRIGGHLLNFGKKVREKTERRSLHPHEGEIVYIDRDRNQTRFRLRLRPQGN